MEALLHIMQAFLHMVCGVYVRRCLCVRGTPTASASRLVAQGVLDDAQEDRIASFLLSEESASEWHLQYELASKVRPCRLTFRLIGLIVPLLFYRC